MSAKPALGEQSLVAHLKELRQRFIKAIGATLTVFLIFIGFANEIYQFIARPLLAALPKNSEMIATEVASPFLTPLKISFLAAIFVSMPYLIYQFWRFISPALYQNERNFALSIVLTSTILFYLGTAFAYFVVFPVLFEFFSAKTPEGVKMMTDIQLYLNFTIKLFFAFGIAFETPIATFILVHSGLVSVKNLRSNRHYVILAAFIIGMLFTPPDVISQIMLALPIWLLFELGLLISARLGNKPPDE